MTVHKVPNYIWINQKKTNQRYPPLGVNQLLHVDQLWRASKIWKTLFFCSFSDVFLLNSAVKSLKRFKIKKKGWKRLKKAVWPAFSCCKHLKAGQNTQHAKIHKNFNETILSETAHLGTQPKKHPKIMLYKCFNAVIC